MLYGKHLGLRGSVKKLAAEGRREATASSRRDRRAQGAGARDALRRARCGASSRPSPRTGSRSTATTVRASSRSWEFPRQAPAIASASPTSCSPEDHVALFVTTAGDRRASGSRRWKTSGEYLKSHAFAALALETAEAAAEWLHRKLRADWGFPDPPEICAQDELLGALPRQALQLRLSRLSGPRRPAALFEALRPEEIGVELTEGDMMDPEASVSALVFHHPDARYFGASGR